MQKQLPPIIAEDSLAVNQAVRSKLFASDSPQEKRRDKLPDQESVGARPNRRVCRLVDQEIVLENSASLCCLRDMECRRSTASSFIKMSTQVPFRTNYVDFIPSLLRCQDWNTMPSYRPPSCYFTDIVCACKCEFKSQETSNGSFNANNYFISFVRIHI